MILRDMVPPGLACRVDAIASRCRDQSEEAADLVHSIAPGHDTHPVAELEHAIAMREHLDIAVADARDEHARMLGQIQVSQPAAGQAAV